METRKITIVSTGTQSVNVINSAATTLGELKDDMRANNISYNNMAFFEGLSKTELKSDSAILPHDIPYKGKITNELVFRLTKAQKNIESGADRKAVYEEIKARGLQSAIANAFGKNFTMCKTVDLENFLKEYDMELAVKTINTKPVIIDNKDTDVIPQLKAKVADLEKRVSVLEGNIVIDTKEVEKLKSESPYSEEELDDILSM